MLSEMVARVNRCREALGTITPGSTLPPADAERARNDSTVRQDTLYQALKAVSEPLGASYLQVTDDFNDPGRTSWAGTAHEVREILATLLRTLAPDDQVEAQPWYRKEPNTSGPTQKQRVRFALRAQGAGSKQRDVVEEVSILEEQIGNLVRATYARASDAAHRMKGRTEARRVLRYFEAFAFDLLNLE
jgi:hypothetical protein